jgi:arsenite methyltransferase
MNSTLQFDEASSRRIESIYSTPDVVAQRLVVREALAVKPGERVLDIGAGPGFLAAAPQPPIRISLSLWGN